MSEQPQPTPPAVGSVDSIIEGARALCQRLVSVEQDPDLMSVFSIARAHGYKVTSKFWHEEHRALAEAVMAYEEAQKQKKPAAETEGPTGKVIDLPPQ